MAIKNEDYYFTVLRLLIPDENRRFEFLVKVAERELKINNSEIVYDKLYEFSVEAFQNEIS